MGRWVEEYHNEWMAVWDLQMKGKMLSAYDHGQQEEWKGERMNEAKKMYMDE